MRSLHSVKVRSLQHETGEAIVNGNSTPLATDIVYISVQMKNMNDRVDKISAESKSLKK